MTGVLEHAQSAESSAVKAKLADLGPLDLYGHGQVGAAFTRLLAARQFTPRSVTTTRGVVAGRRGDEPPAVVVDCTSPAYQGRKAESWISHLDSLLEKGANLVTCNKAPLALAGERLQEAARRGGGRILSSATVGGGVPVLPFLSRLDESLGVVRIEACASGTLGHVLDKIAAGEQLEEAVCSAQELGFAEPDPQLDLDGTDLAAKAVLLHNALGQTLARRLDPSSAPFLGIDPKRVRRIAASGGIPRAVACVERGLVELTIQDAPWAAGAPGDAVVRIQTDDGNRFLIRGPGAGPHVTAANLLADLQALVEHQ